MNWYDSNSHNWYSPNYTRKPAGAAAGTAPAPKPKKKGRVFMIVIVCVLAVLTAGFFIKNIVDGLRSGITYNEDGMPTRWQDYMSLIYDMTDYEPASFPLPTTAGDDDLTLQFAGEGSKSLSFKEIYEKSAPSIVGIKGYDKNMTSFAWGSGMIVSSDGYIVTNAHIIEGCTSAQVLLYNGLSCDVKLVGADDAHDIAVLKIDKTGLTPVCFESTLDLSVGDTVAAIGNPVSPEYSLSMTGGIVSALDREVSRNGSVMKCIQTDTPINGGNSGGPLFNEYGNVVGITNMKLISNTTNIEGMGFAITSDTVRKIVSAIVSKEEPSVSPVLGITVGPIEEMIADYYEIPEGLYVVKVEAGSDAEKTMRAGDIILKVNGKAAVENEDVSDAKTGLKAGDTIHFTVWRDGKSFDTNVALYTPEE